MAQYQIEYGRKSPGLPRMAFIGLIAGIILLLIALRALASYAIEVEWWKELGQLETWLSMLTYSVAPLAGATLLAFAVLWITHARALKFAGSSLRDHSLYAKAAGLGLLVLAYFIAAASIDNWTVVRFAGSRGLQAAAAGATDAVFQKPLSFYLFDLPFYDLLRGYAAGAGDCRDSGLLDRRARLAIALSHRRVARRAGTGRVIPPARRRPGIALPARRGRSAAAGPGRASSIWRATRWCTTSTARFWWAWIGWIRISAFRCSGC